MGLYRGEFPPRHPTFTEGSAARCGDAMPVDVSSPDIVYEEEDDKAIDAYHRQFSAVLPVGLACTTLLTVNLLPPDS
jgi:hypothetical protein